MTSIFTHQRLQMMLIGITLLLLSSCSGGCSGKKESVEVDTSGGTYELMHDITLTVPEGAIAERTEIGVRRFNEDEVTQIAADLGFEDKDLAFVIEASPSGLTFAEPATIVISDVIVPPGIPVLIHQVDLNNSTHNLAEVTTTYDPEKQILELSLSHFSNYAGEIADKLAQRECQANPCRCGPYQSKQSDRAVVCSSGDCQLAESRLEMRYTKCDGDPEISSFKQVDPECKPVFKLEAASSKIPPKGSTDITVTAKLDCIPLEEQTVDFVHDALGDVNPTPVTISSNGKALTKFKAHDQEGTSTVTANATFSYYAYTVEANGQSFSDHPILHEPKATVDIEIANWEGTFQASFTGCNELVCVQDYNVEIKFTIQDINWAAGAWNGEGTLTQSGELTSNIDYLCLQNVYMPDSIQIEAYGTASAKTQEINLEFLTVMGLSTTDFLLYDVCDCEHPELCIELGWASGFTAGVGNQGADNYFTVKLDDKEVKLQGNSTFLLIGMPPDIVGPYTLMVK